MIKNHKIESYGTGFRQRIVPLEDSQLTRDQHLLNSVVGFNYMMSHKKDRVDSNEVRYRTGNAGIVIEASNLSPTNPYIIPFDTLEIKGDRATYKADEYWYFKAGKSGVYRLSTNLKFEIFFFDEATQKVIFNNYLPLIDPVQFGFYRNDSIIQPTMDILISVYNPTNTDYYVNHNRTTYRFQCNQDILFYLEDGDKIDVRAGFKQYLGIATLYLTTWGDVNINYISDKQNYVRA